MGTRSVDDGVAGNFRSYWLGFHRGGAQPGGLTLYRSGLPRPIYNGVLRAASDTPVDVAAAGLRDRFGALPWTWWAGPDSPPSTAERLLTAGAAEGPTFPIMVLDLDHRSGAVGEHRTGPGGLAIGCVTGAVGLAGWVAALAPNFGVTGDDVDTLIDLWRTRADLGDRITRFDATDGGRVAGTAALLAADGVAGIYNVTTAPEYRRRGVASALTAACLSHARRLGLPVATLQARPAGIALYERLGFEMAGAYRTFTLPGAASPQPGTAAVRA